MIFFKPGMIQTILLHGQGASSEIWSTVASQADVRVRALSTHSSGPKNENDAYVVIVIEYYEDLSCFLGETLQIHNQVAETSDCV